MAVQTSVAVANAEAQARETTIGASPRLRLRTGAVPANCAAARSGTVLATIVLPSDWATVSGGVLSKLGTWSVSASASGTAGHWELMDSTLTTCHEQGTVTGTDPGTGDLVLSQESAAIVSGQTVTIDTWTRTYGGL
jgi:hypothetical protein